MSIQATAWTVFPPFFWLPHYDHLALFRWMCGEEVSSVSLQIGFCSSVWSFVICYLLYSHQYFLTYIRCRSSWLLLLLCYKRVHKSHFFFYMEDSSLFALLSQSSWTVPLSLGLVTNQWRIHKNEGQCIFHTRILLVYGAWSSLQAASWEKLDTGSTGPSKLVAILRKHIIQRLIIFMPLWPDASFAVLQLDDWWQLSPLNPRLRPSAVSKFKQQTVRSFSCSPGLSSVNFVTAGTLAFLLASAWS